MPSRKVVLLFFKLCKEIWRGSPATQTMVGSSRLVMWQLRLWSHHRPCRRWFDICIWWWRPPRLWWIGATGLMLSWQATEERDWIDSWLWSITQEYLNIKRHLLRQLEATYEEFKQTLNRWSSTMDNLNSNTEVVVQHIVSSGPSYHMPPPSPHPSSNDSYHEHTPTRRPPHELYSTPHRGPGSSPAPPSYYRDYTHLWKSVALVGHFSDHYTFTTLALSFLCPSFKVFLSYLWKKHCTAFLSTYL